MQPIGVAAPNDMLTGADGRSWPTADLSRSPHEAKRRKPSIVAERLDDLETDIETTPSNVAAIDHM